MEVCRWLGKVKYASAVMLESLDHPQTHVGEAGSPRSSKKSLYKILVQLYTILVQLYMILVHKPLTALSLGVSTFFSASTIYILLLIFSLDPLYSREYSRISRIFLSLGRSTEAKNRSKYTVVAPKPPRIAQKSKISACIDPKPTVEGQTSCFGKL